MPLTKIHLIFLLHKTELLESLLYWHRLSDEGARFLIWLASSAADYTIDPTVQDVEALLRKVSTLICYVYPGLQSLPASAGQQLILCRLSTEHYLNSRVRRCCFCGCWKLSPEAQVCWWLPLAAQLGPGVWWHWAGTWDVRGGRWEWISWPKLRVQTFVNPPISTQVSDT